MARIKIAYLGGGSSRAPGTMASFIHHGAEFDGSEFVLIDLDPDHLEITRRMAAQMAKARRARHHRDRHDGPARKGCADVDAVLSSFRPGGFEARALDERIPLKYGVIGQETQGPGGADDVAAVGARSCGSCAPTWRDVAPRRGSSTTPTRSTSSPRRWRTTPTSRSSRSARDRSSSRRSSRRPPASTRPSCTANMVGVNHNVWSNEATYDGQDAIAVLRERWEELRGQAAPTDVNGTAPCTSPSRWRRSRRTTSTTTTSATSCCASSSWPADPLRSRS